MTDPKTRKDGKCAHCGKPKKRSRAKKGTMTGVRVSRQLWLQHLERDPFCSRECCEAFHHTGTRPLTRECANEDCTVTFTPQARSAGVHRFCCKACRDASERRRKGLRRFSIPGRCAGCGGEYENVTRGCGHCWDRERCRRRRVEDPAYLERERVWQREYKRRKRQESRVAA